MPFDYKKEYKEFYLPPAKPALVTLPPVNYIAVRGQGDPNVEAGEFFHYEEGLCVQCMHIGPYDNEPETISSMTSFAESNGYQLDPNPSRLHHEIYLSDPRRTAPEKLKTVIRIPVLKFSE